MRDKFEHYAGYELQFPKPPGGACEILLKVLKGSYKRSIQWLKCGTPLYYKVCNVQGFTHVCIFADKAKSRFLGSYQWTIALVNGTGLKNLPKSGEGLLSARILDRTTCEHRELSRIQQWGIATKLQVIPEILCEAIKAFPSTTISINISPIYSSTVECDQSISSLRSRIRAQHRNKIGTPTGRIRRVEVRVEVKVDVMCEWMHHSITLCAGMVTERLSFKGWIGGADACEATKKWLLDQVTPECCRVTYDGNKAEMAMKTLNGSIPYRTSFFEEFNVILKTLPVKRRRTHRQINQQCGVCNKNFVYIESGARHCPHCVRSVISGACSIELLASMFSPQVVPLNYISV